MVNAVNPPNVWSPFGAFSMAVIQGDGHCSRERSSVARSARASRRAKRHRGASAQGSGEHSRHSGNDGWTNGGCDFGRSLCNRYRCIHEHRQHSQGIFCRTISGHHNRSGRTSIPSRVDDRDRCDCRNSSFPVSPPVTGGLDSPFSAMTSETTVWSVVQFHPRRSSVTVKPCPTPARMRRRALMGCGQGQASNNA